MTGVIRLDLHIHSIHSPDSHLTLDNIVDLIGPRGLSGFALTDHNTVAGHADLLALAKEYPRYLIVPGVEVSTREGHLLAYGVGEVPPVGRPVQETIDWVDGHGGVAVLAHPLRYSHGVGRRLLTSLNVRGVETVNSHNRPVANARAEVLAAQRRLASTGGSDAHVPDDIGRAYTEVSDAVTNVRDLVQEIRGGRSTGAGRAMTPAERLQVSFRSALLRTRRGFRPI